MISPDTLAQLSQLSLRSVLAHGIRVEASIFIVVSGILYYILPYLQDSQGLRRYPGPWLAKFSCFWYTREILQGHMNSSMKHLHEKYGTFVRIGPNNVSIRSPDALQAIYAHSSGALKSSMYDAFAPFGAARSIFNTRDRAEHTRKRKLLAHMFAAKSLLEVAPIIYSHERLFVKHWDEMCGSAAQGNGGTKGDCTWEAKDGRAWFNAMPWFNYIAFDVIGDLAFGAPFGMLAAVKAETPVAQTAEQAMDTYTSKGSSRDIKYHTINAVETINATSAFTSFLGNFPLWVRPYIGKLPLFQRGLKSRATLASMAATTVSRRLNSEKPMERRDFVSKLLEGRDENGQPMGKQELSAEALTLMAGGSDTTSNTSAALLYYLAQNPSIQRKLQAALDVALGPPDFSLPLEEAITEDNLTKLKDCEYLINVINEGLRVHSTLGFGLPRVVPEGGLTICGEMFKEGTIVSTPGLALHRMKEIWGEDADVFNPERWERENKDEMHRAFAPFSIGPRACIGRNLAQMELQAFIGTLSHRYDVALASPDQELEVHEAFVRKPERVYVGVKQRKISSV